MDQSTHIQEEIHKEKLLEQKKLINFEELKQEYNKMTQFSLPFTTHHIEDVIFVGKRRLITLEYIFYDGRDRTKYSKLRKLRNEMPSDRQDNLQQQTFNSVPTEFQATKPTYLQSKKQNVQMDPSSPEPRIDEEKSSNVKFMRIKEEEPALKGIEC